MESDLFDWELSSLVGDQLCLGKLCFSNCTLKKDIGEFTAGTRFAFIVIDLHKRSHDEDAALGILHLFREPPPRQPADQATAEFEVHLVVGKKL